MFRPCVVAGVLVSCADVSGYAAPSASTLLSACPAGQGDQPATIWSEWQLTRLGDWSGKAPMAWPVSDNCANAAAAVIGLDDRSFEEAVEGFDSPTTATDLVVSAGLQLGLVDLGTVGDLRESLSPTELLTIEYPDGVAPGMADDAPASAFFLQYVQRRVTQVTSRPSSIAACTLQYADGIVDVCFDDDIFESGSERYLVFPPMLAAALVHEAGHVDCPAHIDMGGKGVDETCDGCYGVGARVLERWIVAHAQDAFPLDMAGVREGLDDACAHIIDQSGGCGCDGASE